MFVLYMSFQDGSPAVNPTAEPVLIVNCNIVVFMAHKNMKNQIKKDNQVEPGKKQKNINP